MLSPTGVSGLPIMNEIRNELTIRRHHLPHWQVGGAVYFVTFRSARGSLPATALRIVKDHILFDRGRRYVLFFAVIMPDHVHLLIQPREKGPGSWYDLSEILKSLKGASSQRINQLLGTQGNVWQKEISDRIVRDEKEFEEKRYYMWKNPQIAGFVGDPEKYEFFVFPEDG